MGDTFHAGERWAQQRFNSPEQAERVARLGAKLGQPLDEEKRRFIESLSFFFLATADRKGHCDCSFKGTELDAEGALLPVLRVIDSRRLIFPDYAGNGLFNSLGNIIDNPHVGMIFIDFAMQTRLRINGTARLLEQEGEWCAHWPQAPRAIEVNVEQSYWNCAKRIPKQP